MSFAAKAEAPDFEITAQPTDLTITEGQEGFFGPSPSFSTISNAVEGLYRCLIIHGGGVDATRQPTLTIVSMSKWLN